MSGKGLILGIESSCDETAAAVVARGRRVLSSVVASQIDLHAVYGGVVPEIASRAHVEKIAVVIRQALAEAGATLGDMDAIAVTYAPGLIGALLVGVETAKALSLASRKPLVAVHHVRAHLYSPFLESSGGTPQRILLAAPSRGSRSSLSPCQPAGVDGQEWEYPYLGLAVSGGHSSLARAISPMETEQIGETRDDAVGEAYDKVAKLLGLGYPGGPLIDRLAADGDASRFALPRPMMASGDLDFSFSGLKTAVRLLVESERPRNGGANGETFLRDLSAAFQAAVIDVLLAKTRRAAKQYGLRRVAIVGGVACNRGLRAAAAKLADDGLRAVAPHPSLCGDNAAMVAGLGYHLFTAGERAPLTLNPRSSMRL